MVSKMESCFLCVQICDIILCKYQFNCDIHRGSNRLYFCFDASIWYNNVVVYANF